MSLDETLYESIEPFIDKGLITEVLQTLKSGKEATVFSCRGGARLGGRLVAVKVYRPLEQRQFRNNAVYRAGKPIIGGGGRLRRAIEGSTDFGKQLAFGMWVGQEWGFLKELHAAGIDVPRPIDHAGDALVMEYIGDESGPAEQLRGVRLTEAEAGRVWDRVVWNIKQMLQMNRVHGDLSPYNLLWHEGRARIIDVPQMSDPRENPNARDLLNRDIENVWRYCSKFVSLPDPWKLADSLWTRFRYARL